MVLFFKYNKIFWNTQHDADKGDVLTWYVWSQWEKNGINSEKPQSKD